MLVIKAVTEGVIVLDIVLLGVWEGVLEAVLEGVVVLEAVSVGV